MTGLPVSIPAPWYIREPVEERPLSEVVQQPGFTLPEIMASYIHAAGIDPADEAAIYIELTKIHFRCAEITPHMEEIASLVRARRVNTDQRDAA